MSAGARLKLAVTHAHSTLEEGVSVPKARVYILNPLSLANRA